MSPHDLPSHKHMLSGPGGVEKLQAATSIAQVVAAVSMKGMAGADGAVRVTVNEAKGGEGQE